MRVQFKRATLADIEIILSLMPGYYESDHLKFELSKARQALEHFLAEKNIGQLWLIEENTKIIGYMALTYCFSFECGGLETFVDELYVLEEYRGKGIGSAAIEHAKVECKKANVQVIRLEVTSHNEGASRLYKKLGFEDLGRTLLAYWVNPGAKSV